MNVVIITTVVVTLTVLFGVLMAAVFVVLSNLVTAGQATVEQEKKSYNPNLTLGYKIPVEADLETQLKKARLEAAKRAASLPRGANLRIGRLGAENKDTAREGALKHDPLTAVRIAAFHGWQGLRSGAATGQQAAITTGATAARPAAPAKRA
ncbi:MAG: hypothetical protein L0322_24050, partial [Chloroflexi bacterium]|nr:hypothetical protein [Chloroflexota bacterium]